MEQNIKKNYNIRNILGYQTTDNNEFYTPKETVISLIQDVFKELPKDKVIWCPFDKEESEFVRQFKQNGYRVINSHIDNEEDFYTFEPSDHWDIIVSNPPFNKKRLLIERCLNFNKPFCLLYGATIFSQSMGDTLNKCDFHFIQKSVKFTLPNASTKSFQCCWVFNKGFQWK